MHHVFKMRKKEFIILGLMLLITLSAATTTTQPSKTDILKADWNRTICIALRVLQIVSVGIAALLIMVAGLKYMSSDDANERTESRNMIMRVLSALIVIAVAAQVVNYLAAGSNVGSIDIESCNDLFPTTTRGGGPTTAPTTATTSTTTNGTTTTVSTTSSTTTTLGGLCLDPSSKYSIYGDSNACDRASSIDMCNTDFYPTGGNGITELDEMLGAGFSQCCCSPPAGYPKCCGIRKMT
jgi:hypothetical protein